MNLRIGLLCWLAFLLGCETLQAQTQTLRNSTTTIVINGGLNGNGLVPYGGLFKYHDHAHGGEETTWSVDPVLILPRRRTLVLSRKDRGGFQAPVAVDEKTIRCVSRSGSIDVSVDFELIGSNARQTFRFHSPTPFDGSTFLYYAENDLFGHANDIASFTGSIQTRDLTLYMYDSAAGGLSVKLSGVGVKDAKLTKFGAGIWTKWGAALERGDLRSLSDDGRNFKRFGDTGLALAFSLHGKSPVVVINYDSQPLPPNDPQSLAYLQNKGRQQVAPKTSRKRSTTKPTTTTPAKPAKKPEPLPNPESMRDLATKSAWRLKDGGIVLGRFQLASKQFRTVILLDETKSLRRIRLDELHEKEQELVEPELK